MINFADRLLVQVKQKDNPTVLGLDPQLSYVPEFIRKEVEQDVDNLMEVAAESLFRFNCGLIDAVADLIPAVKPQLAYYEMYGMAGLRAFRKTCSYAREKGLLVIADAKRGDIGPTAGAYARAYLGRVELDEGMSTQLYEIDALTVNAYLGFDGVEPFLFHSNGGEKGIFLLVRTSNPSAGDLQDLTLQDGRRVYEAMGDLVSGWGELFVGELGYSSVGAVVGATWPQQAAALRKRLPRTLILVPGYGAQGATGQDVAVNFDQNGLGAVVNASRSLMCAYQKEAGCDPRDYAGACRRAALKMQDDLNRSIAAYHG
jgi:orotidine-5'-phosphate decarboxylase